MDIVFVTHNGNKLKEIAKILPNRYHLLNLSEIGFKGEIPETQPTIKGNAIQKVKYVEERINLPCFADDTGLEIDGLNGQPGVFSARFAGPSKDPVLNRKKVLTLLAESNQRTARFRTVIALILNHQLHTFEGIAEGTITMREKGSEGFGYDSIFLPLGFNQTFAEMDLTLKNTISHRAMALKKMVEFLSSIKTQ